MYNNILTTIIRVHTIIAFLTDLIYSFQDLQSE